MRHAVTSRLVVAACGFFCVGSQAWQLEETFHFRDESELPVIAIIIDDLGHGYAQGRRAITLPGPVAMSVLPHTPHARQLAREAHASGKEVMLHLPLEADSSNQLLGPGAIMLDVTRDQFSDLLRRNLEAIPYASGVNNHMGSLLTRHPGHMAWLMADLKRHDGLFFVDSRTTGGSVAWKLALETGVPSAKRDVFLDDNPDPERVAQQLERLKVLSRRHGAAIAIGHPYPVTMDLLERALPTFRRSGYRLIAVKDLIDLQSRLSGI